MCLAIKARLEPGLMRLRSYTLFLQHFTKVISYPTRQTHGSLRTKHSSFLDGRKKKKKEEPELGTAPFACHRMDFIFVLQGRTNVGETESESEFCVPRLIRMRVSCGILFHSRHIYTLRRKAAMENHLEFVKRCSQAKAVKQQLSPRLSTHHSPLSSTPPLFPTLINNAC